MKKYALRTAGIGLAAGIAALFFGTAPAGADVIPQSAASSAEGNGVGTGNSVVVNAAAPIDIECDLTGIGGVGVGFGFSECVDTPDHISQNAASSAKGNGVIAGNSGVLNLAIPVDVKCVGQGIGGVGLGIGASSCK